jgi:acetylornithine deacetylase/succinyl-diaminopimelate desuccinylase-like protein
VVKADGDWLYPPFGACLEDGIIYGRGTLDTKQLTVMELMAMLLVKREKLLLKRPVIFVASADEEGGSNKGMKYLTGLGLIPQGDAISEGGGFVIQQDGRRFRTCAMGEKGSCVMSLAAGAEEEELTLDHTKSTAYKLLESMQPFASYKAEPNICAVMGRFSQVAAPITDQTLMDMWEYGTHAAMVFKNYDLFWSVNDSFKNSTLELNYNFIPGTSRQDIEDLLSKLGKGKVVLQSFEEGYMSDSEGTMADLLAKKSEELDPGTVLLPVLALGRTDGRFLGAGVYGYSPLLEDMPFKEVLKKVHQNNECITVNSLLFGPRVIYESLKEFALKEEINYE